MCPCFSHACLSALKQYALLTYGNMPVQPRLRVKILLKFKYENIVWLAFQKNLYSKTRLDGHITICEKNVFPLYVPLFFTRVFECSKTTPLICAHVFHTLVGVLWNNSPCMCPCFSHACPRTGKQLSLYVPLFFTRVVECCEATPGSGRSCSERTYSSPVVSASARGVTSNHARPRTIQWRLNGDKWVLVRLER